MAIFKKGYVSHLVLLCGASVALSGCGYKWPEWAVVDIDPLSSLSPEDRSLAPEPPNFAPVKGPVYAYGNALQNVGPLEVKPEGHLGSFGLNLDEHLADGPQKVGARLDRLEDAVLAIHEDLKRLVPVVQKMQGEYRASKSETPTPYFPVQHENAVLPDAAPVPLSGINKMDNVVQNDGVPMNLVQGQAGIAGLDVKSSGVSVGQETDYEALQVALSDLVGQPQDKIGGAQSHLPKAPKSGAKTAVSEGPRKVNASSGAVVTGVRVGDHPDKIRLVFDVTSKTSFSADIDNDEKLLVVEMPNASWNVPSDQVNFSKYPVLKSYNVSDMNGGQGRILVVQLKNSSRILMKKSLPALSGAGQRLVLDLQK